MKTCRLIIILLLLVAANGFSQQKLIKHTVLQGETLTKIAQKYNTSSAEILKLNPDAQAGLKTNMIVLVYTGNSQITSDKMPKNAPVTKTHIVAGKETVFGLAKEYNTTIQALEKANPSLVNNGLKVGDTIVIPNYNATKLADSKVVVRNNTSDNTIKPIAGKIIYHQVEAKETKYSIAKQYNISIAELEAANPEIVAGLQIGFRIKIVENLSLRKSDVIIKGSQDEIIKPAKAKIDELEYIVKPKETLYSLMRKFGIDQKEMYHLNPELKNGLTAGMVLKFPSDIIINEDIVKTNTDLSQKLNTDTRKKLVLLLPFNVSKIENDTVNSFGTRLKSDKFLNMTLDFYAGAMIAIDSAKTLGLNIDVSILDSEENKNNSNVSNLIQRNKLANADVVIGPFYQSNVENAADLLQKTKTIVISPLSKDSSKSYPNLIVATPSNDLLKTAIFDYMKSKNGSIVAIIDPKKQASKRYILESQKEVKFVKMDVKGGFIADSLSYKLVKNKMNYVILDSEKTGTILKTINTLINLQSTFQIQLVILEKNETLDFEEIPLAKLAKLRMLYPSISKESLSTSGDVFEKEFRLANKILPNQFATRGFDLTFDTLIRLSQEQSFVETVENAATEQVENKFDYNKTNSGTYSNTGIYILYFDTDLSVKMAQ